MECMLPYPRVSEKQSAGTGLRALPLESNVSTGTPGKRVPPSQGKMSLVDVFSCRAEGDREELSYHPSWCSVCCENLSAKLEESRSGNDHLPGPKCTRELSGMCVNCSLQEGDYPFILLF